MLGVHTMFLVAIYGTLPRFNFIAIAPCAVADMLILVIPFLLIRKHKGAVY